MDKNNFTVPFGDSELKIDFNTDIDQAPASLMLGSKGTTVLISATINPKIVEGDFTPLRVDFVERYYTVRQIAGNRYSRREEKPSDEAILSARAIDRSIRPYLPDNLRQPLHLVVTVLSLGDQDPDSLGIIGSSLALYKLGLIDNLITSARLSINEAGEVFNRPSFKTRKQSTSNALISSCDNLIHAIELDGQMIAEDQIINLAVQALGINQKLSEAIMSQLDKDFVSKVALEEVPTSNNRAEIAEKLSEGWRPDGRSAAEIRDLSISLNTLEGLHGSAKFKRGATAVLATTTLDCLSQKLSVAGIEDIATGHVAESFILHYNFPPYAVGVADRISKPNRREIGHGHLVAKSISPVLPSTSDYPYAIRVVCETLSSDGSSSMASVSAASLALLAAGVPIDSLVAGISIGLAGGQSDQPVLLTDITAEEDNCGEMDLKIAGTKHGITAIQLDTKNKGISLKVFQDSLVVAKTAREKILEEMSKLASDQVFSHPENAPLVVTIPPSHIGRLIGRGGSNIRSIEEKSGARIEIQEDRFAVVRGTNEAKQQVLSEIEAETREYHVGEDFSAKVREFLPYGAIVELSAGREALLHVSELQDKFVEKTEDLLKIGDEVPVTIVETSSDGRIKVSIREKHPEFFNKSN